jgi:RNA polymerase sigma factor (sigma-70 family)
MRQLSPDQRHIVDLRLAGLTGPEIAEVLGMSESAVKSSQFRAYSRLRKLLAEEDIFGDHS